MVDYIRSHYRRATFFMIAMLCVAGLSASAFVAVKTLASEYEEKATLSITNARAALDSGDIAASGLALIQCIDTYPETEAKFEAYEMLEDLRKRLSAGEVPVEVMLEFEARLPAVKDLKTAEAQHILHLFFLSKANLLGKIGMTDLARDLVQSSGDSVLETLYACPDSAWHIGMLPIVFENAVKYAPEYAESYAKALEEFTAATEPCMASFCARYALTGYYLHEGMSRDAAERHMAVMLDATSHQIVKAALADPYLKDSEKACLLWAEGYAAFEMGRTEEALGVFHMISAQYPTAGREKEWADITIPAAYKKLYPKDVSIAEAAYQDYLTTHDGHEYAQWALLELGNMAVEAERFDEAASYFSQVESEFPSSAAARMASAGRAKSITLKALKSGAGTD